jgi:uncharacterized protein YabN with tetrapyrrole methylase and pyrophosphatase domain
MEELIQQDSLDIKEMTLQEMDIYWEKAKKLINKDDRTRNTNP